MRDNKIHKACNHVLCPKKKGSVLEQKKKKG